MLRMSVLAFALIASAAFAQQRDESEVFSIEAKDPDMVAAIRKAHAGLDEFLKLSAKPAPGTEDYRLKVMVKDKNDTEHFWVTPFRQVGTGFEGVLANTPKVVSNVKAGQTLRFGRDDISDWGYVKNGRQVGSFTVCAMFKRMPAEQVTYYRKNHGFDC